MNDESKQVLIVDGHEDVLISLEKLLEDAGFATKTAWSARDARLLLKYQRFAVALVGECLPDERSEDFCRNVRGRRDGTRVIILKASSPLVDDGRRFLQAGAFAVNSKYDESTILSAVRSALSSHSGDEAEHLTYG